MEMVDQVRPWKQTAYLAVPEFPHFCKTCLKWRPLNRPCDFSLAWLFLCEQRLICVFIIHNPVFHHFSFWQNPLPSNPPSVHPASQWGPPNPAVLCRPPFPAAPRPSPRRARHPFAITTTQVQPEFQHSPPPFPQPSPRSKHNQLLLSDPLNSAAPPVAAPENQSDSSEVSPSPKSLLVTPIQESSLSLHHPTLPECGSILPPASTRPSPASGSSANMSSPEVSSSGHTISSSSMTPQTSLILSTSLTPETPSVLPLKSSSPPKPIPSSQPLSAHPPVTWTFSQPPPLPRIFQSASGKGTAGPAD